MTERPDRVHKTRHRRVIHSRIIFVAKQLTGNKWWTAKAEIFEEQQCEHLQTTTTINKTNKQQNNQQNPDIRTIEQATGSFATSVKKAGIFFL